MIMDRSPVSSFAFCRRYKGTYPAVFQNLKSRGVSPKETPNQSSFSGLTSEALRSSGGRSFRGSNASSRDFGFPGAAAAAAAAPAAAPAGPAALAPSRPHPATARIHEIVGGMGFKFEDVALALKVDGHNPDALVEKMLMGGTTVMDGIRAQAAALQLSHEESIAPRPQPHEVASTFQNDLELAKKLAEEEKEWVARKKREEEETNRAVAAALAAQFHEEERQRAAAVPAVPMVSCAVCTYGDEPDCPLDTVHFFDACGHTVCFECLKGMASAEFEDGGRIPCCPALEDDVGRCSHVLTEAELKMIFISGDNPNFEMEAKVTEAYLRVALNQMKAVGCPRPGCPNSIIPSIRGIPEKCECSCGMIYCSECQEPFHYDTDCAEATAHAVTWDNWLNVAHGTFLEHKAQTDAAYADALADFNKKKDEYNKELEASMIRRRAFEQDEAWKAANCRRCPHCNRPINKLQGCDSMVCGQDAHGGNVQPGCGQSFSWSSARPYNQDTGGAAGADPTFDEAAPEREAEDVIIGRTRSGQAIKMRCDRCSEDVGELAFECINCAGKYAVCLRCMPVLTQGQHDGTHVFKIIGNWNVAAAGGGGGGGAGPAAAPGPAL
mmetsp:Transcript_2880/g.8669  ORF Transcript_2880/g.8669 Transcript_2880/m.8669 type:complete len:609 (+) Transcript_2880:834-2660(+)